MSRVLVAMSGGVDSSVAASLLVDEGYEVFGITLRLCESEEASALRGKSSNSRRSCCITEDVNDARKVCQILGIPHYVLNFQEQFMKWVVEPSCREYSAGRTPNPCLLCNQHIKFRFLLSKALSLGAGFIATGHYARVQEDDGHFRLMKAADEGKDQSYFLYCLGQEELKYLLLPLGRLTKKEVRQIARAKGLPVAAKQDSQDLCFVPGGDLRTFLKQRLECRPGRTVDLEGNILGQHEGIAFYTVGQRIHVNPMPGFSRGRMYVARILPEENMLIAGKETDLFSSRLKVGEINWVNPDSVSRNAAGSGQIPVRAKIRYGSASADAMLHLNGSRTEVYVSFLRPQRAVTPGQAAVFYAGEEVIGGGVILDAGI